MHDIVAKLPTDVNGERQKIFLSCAFAPSLTDTPLAASLLNTDAKVESNVNRHPLKRIGKPEDMASLATFLLSENASWMTGQIINLDGGISTIHQSK